MKGTHKRRWRLAAALALCCLVLVAWWQWQSLIRVAIVAAAQTFAHVNLSFGRAQIGGDRAVFDNVRVTSFRNEPIAQISHLEIAYDLRDLLPGGRPPVRLKISRSRYPLRHDRSARRRNLQRADSAEAHSREPRSAAYRARTRAGRLDRRN